MRNHADRDDQRDARAIENAREDIAAELIGAEPMCVAGREQAMRQVDSGGIVGRGG